MKRKTFVVVVSANNAAKRRNRAGFSFSSDPRAVSVTLDRKLALESDPILKVYRATSDHAKRATGKEEMPNSLQKKFKDGVAKIHTQVIATTDYPRSIDSIMNELEMMGPENVLLVAEDLGVKVGKDEDEQKTKEKVGAALLELEAEPTEAVPQDKVSKKDSKKDDEEEEETEEDADDTEDDDGELTEEKVHARFAQLDKMTEEKRVKLLEKHGFENEGDKLGQILAIMTEELGEEVNDFEMPEVTEEGSEETTDDDKEEGTEDATEDSEDDETEEDAPVQPKKVKTQQKPIVKQKKGKAAKTAKKAK